MSKTKSSSKALRVGVVGASFGGKVHVPAFRASGAFEVVALASPARASIVAREREIAHAFSSLDEMLAGAELDVVSIASPPYEHRRQVLAALAHGKHVLCEKPFGLNVAECEEMLAASTAAGTVCAIAHEFRYLPSRLAIYELIRAGHLGAMREIEVTLTNAGLAAGGERPNSWWFERARGGGITGAILSHLVDSALWLGGAPVMRASGIERTANPERGPEGERFTSDVADGAFALIALANSVIARCSVDFTHAVEGSLLAAHGEGATAVSSGRSMVDSATFVVDEDESSELELKASPHSKLGAANPNLPAFADLVDDFARAIQGDATPHLPTFADGLATQRVLEATGYTTSSL